MEFLSREGLNYFWQQIVAKFVTHDESQKFVTKEDGKGLSSEDYTSEEKAKLASLSTTAEANQNAFGIVNTKSGSVNTTLNAAEEVSALNFEAGANITLAVNAATNTIKIIGAEAPEAPEASLENLGISATATEINHIAGATSNIQNQLNNRFDIVDGGTSIAANTDLNTLITPGNYRCVTSIVETLVNCPITEGGFKLVVINGYTAEYKHQFIYWGAQSYIYYRTRNSNGTWKDWVLLNNVSLANADGTLPISKGGTGATTAAEALTKLGAAPSGYGLGTTGTYCANANNANKSGWYGVDANTTNIPSGAAGVMFVKTLSTTNGTDIYQTITSGVTVIQRYYSSWAGAWQSWEYVNPPMTTNIEYRTAERVDDKAVYKKKDSSGQILYRLDGETEWKVQAGLMGAAPTSHTHSDYLNITAAGATIAKNTDLNTITTPGHYSCVSGNNKDLSNCPLSSGGFKLIVIQGYSTGYISQFIMAGASHKYFYRSCNSSGTWYAWVDLTDKTPAEHTHDYVPTSRTVNGKALSSNITLSASDVSAVPTSRTINGKALSSNITLSASDVSAVPASRTINGKALSSNITLSASDVSARSNTWVPALTDCSGTLSVAKGGTGATDINSARANLKTACSYNIYDKPTGYDNVWYGWALTNYYASPTSANTWGDAYYMLVSSDGTLRVGTQLNDATSITWSKVYSENYKPTPDAIGAAPATHTHPEYYNISSVGTAIAENADLNTYTTPGTYYAFAATAAKLSNSPTTSGFRLIVERGYSTGRYIQRALGGSTSNAEWVRYYSGSAWGTWQRTVRSNSASSAYPTYLQTYSSYAATLGFGCSDSGMWIRAFRDGEYGEYLYLTKDSKNVYTYARGAADTKVSTLYGTANIHYGSSTPTGAYTGQLWFKPV